MQTQTQKIVEGRNGRLTIWPGKKVYYYPNLGCIHGNGRSSYSNSYGEPISAEIIKITSKKVRIKITQGGYEGKEMSVDYNRVGEWYEPVKFIWEK